MTILIQNVNQPGFICLADGPDDACDLPEGRYYNLVVLSPDEAGMHWAGQKLGDSAVEFWRVFDGVISLYVQKNEARVWEISH